MNKFVLAAIMSASSVAFADSKSEFDKFYQVGFNTQNVISAQDLVDALPKILITEVGDSVQCVAQTELVSFLRGRQAVGPNGQPTSINVSNFASVRVYGCKAAVDLVFQNWSSQGVIFTPVLATTSPAFGFSN